MVAKQATNRVSTIKLPDDQYTKTGGEIVRESFSVHFSDAMLIDESNNWQGQ
jgi:hypothetical protein